MRRPLITTSRYNQHVVSRVSLNTAILIAATFVLNGADRKISFGSDIQPILQSNCAKCHGSAMQLSKLDLSSRDSALRGGEHGLVLLPGNAAKSRIYRMVAGLEKPAMPLGGKLTMEQVENIRLWIEQGAG